MVFPQIIAIRVSLAACLLDINKPTHPQYSTISSTHPSHLSHLTRSFLYHPESTSTLSSVSILYRPFFAPLIGFVHSCSLSTTYTALQCLQTLSCPPQNLQQTERVSLRHKAASLAIAHRCLWFFLFQEHIPNSKMRKPSRPPRPLKTPVPTMPQPVSQPMKQSQMSMKKRHLRRSRF